MNGSIDIFDEDAEIEAEGSSEANFTETDISTQPTWISAVLNIKVVNSEDVPGRAGESLDIYWAVTTVADEETSSNIRACAQYMKIQLPSAAEGVAYFVSPEFRITGSTMYLWFAHEPWANGNTRTITITINGVDYGPVVA